MPSGEARRIHIIGGPGSGKTTLAKKLSEHLNIQAYDLDDLYWRNDDETYDAKRDPAERDEKFKATLKKESWIIEAAYGGWTEPGFKAADLIVILEPPTRTRQWRIIKRFLKIQAGLERAKQKERWKDIPQFLKWSKHYPEKDFPNIQKTLDKYRHKTIKLTKKRPTIEDVIRSTKPQKAR